jgi:hypothetical protein
VLFTRDKDDEAVEIVVDDDIDDTDVEITEATTEGNVAWRLSTTTRLYALRYRRALKITSRIRLRWRTNCALQDERT